MPTSRLSDPHVAALLGPTNTGKTHRAIERMLEHRSGMIGLPLRLLAREVYDKVVERRGPEAVALVTGEERRVPDDPLYFVCTVEAMPVDRKVAFVAVDEVQLAGDRNRGHTFTDRILHARGAEETLFLGAMTVAPLLERLVPGIEIHTAPRLSKLSWSGVTRLTGVPPRSAVVAFSAEKVYEAAERLRGVHGGAAVVLGALSPRTRNAQVAMYQAGEVQHLVATDAIGMGLNMDVQHVAFTAVHKFDGRGFRDLSPAEVAQVAGRAGRYRTDGTFGSTRELGPLDPNLVDAVESHDFAPLPALYWRSSALDFSSAEALLRSLRVPPPSPFLIPAHADEDLLALEELARREAVVERLGGEESVRVLWEVCRIPDYRKTQTDAHVELLGTIALHRLGPEGVVPDAFVTERIGRLDRTDGDIDTLLSRIAWIRTWTYVAWQPEWTSRPDHWQEITRAVEERLSDALHERLTARFVDRRVTLVLGGKGAPLEVEAGEVRVGGLRVGRVRDWSFEPEVRTAVAAIRRRLRTDAIGWLQALAEVDDEEIALDEQGRVSFAGAVLAHVEAGPSILEPKVVVHRLDLLEGGERERVRTRLDRWRYALVEHLFAPLARPAAGTLGAAGRGLLFAMRSALGTVERAEVEESVRALTPSERAALARLDVRLGTEVVYVQSLLKLERMKLRAALWSIARGVRPFAVPPADGRSTFDAAGVDRGLIAAMGYVERAGLAIRADVLERVAAEARSTARSRDGAPIERFASWLGCSLDQAARVLGALGWRLRTGDEGSILLAARAR
jgi:ATP-dependent RNA helicase SUPV3L1/SUV3